MRLLAPPEFPADPDPGALLQLWRALEPARPGEPALRGVMITTVDGAAAVDGRSGPMGTPTDHLVYTLMRARADAIVVGARTALTEGYGPVVVDPRWAHLRHHTRTAARLLLVARAVPVEIVELCRAAGPDAGLVVPCGAPGLDAARAAGVTVHQTPGPVAEHLPDLLAGLGLREVACEGGPRLLGALLAQDALDELVLSVAPRLDAAPGTTGLVAGESTASREFRVHTAFTAPDGGLYTRWVRARADEPGPEGPR